MALLAGLTLSTTTTVPRCSNAVQRRFPGCVALATPTQAPPVERVSVADDLPSISSAKRVVLVRHGQSTWNEAGRIQGSSDFSVLTAKGEAQAETCRQLLLADSFDVCFYSPLARAHRTAQIIWGSRQGPMIPIYDLREIDLYSFQGLMKDKGKELYGDVYVSWQKDAPNFVIDGHYPVRELWDRAQSCWQTILRSDGQSILLVAHNAINQALVATATGLPNHYFRHLLQSNCGVSVLDFTPPTDARGPPRVCLNRLNQTPSPPLPVAAGKAAAACILLVCHGATNRMQNRSATSPNKLEQGLNMLGLIQSSKTAELLLDVRVDTVLCSPQSSVAATAAAIVQVQEAADCLGADCVPRYVQVKEMPDLEDLNRDGSQEIPRSAQIQPAFWEKAGIAWRNLLQELGDDKILVVVGHEMTHAAIIGHCLSLTQASIPSVKLDPGSVSVIEFPHGTSGKRVIRCLNYTAHLGRWAVPVTRPALADEEF